MLMLRNSIGFLHVFAHLDFEISSTFQKRVCFPQCCITSSFKETVSIWEISQSIPA